MNNLSASSNDLTLAAAVNDKHRTRVEHLGRMVQLSGITLGSIMPLAALASLTIHWGSFWYNLPLIVFYDSNFGATPALIMLFWYGGLLRSFFLGSSSKAASVARGVLAGLIFIACTSTGPVALFYYFAGLLGWITACKLGQAMRSALPESFRFDRALTSLFVGALPSLGYMMAINMGILHPHAPLAGAIAHFSPSYVLSVTTVLAFSLALQAFLLSRCARTTNPRPVLLLSLLMASPVLLTALFAPISAAFCAELSGYTYPLFVASFCMALAGICATGVGAFAGAKANEVSHDLKIQNKKSLGIGGSGF